MKLTGTISSWFYLVFITSALWILYVRATGDTIRFTPYVFAFLLPLAAGTGLLTAARAGRLDLLFGGGETRGRLWWAAFNTAWLLPSILVTILFILSGLRDSWGVVARLPALLLFAGGVAFAVGLVEMRYTVGVLWLFSRLIFLMTIGALERTLALSRGELPSAGALALMILAAPEMLLERGLPIPWLIAAALVGVAAVMASYVWFAKADLGGKRS